MMMAERQPARLLILGAHPDDAEFHAGGLATRWARRGDVVKMVSVTDGGAGHHQRDSKSLVALRREEAARAGAVISAEYVTWDFPDGRLQPTLEVRERIIREIRQFQPQLVLTHRPCDYHPDHRAVGQAVQDASYLVTVPLVCPDTPFLRRDPVVAYMCDLFTKPYPLQPDFLLDIEAEMPTIVAMLAEHASQVFEFLPFNQGIEDQTPEAPEQRRQWLAQWYGELIAPRARFFEQMAESGEANSAVRFVEAYEISEYAGRASTEQLRQWFCQPPH